MRNIGGILLAAGQSTRMGRKNKLLMPVDHTSEPMIRIAAKTMLDSQLDQSMIILGHEAGYLTDAISDLPIAQHVNPNYAKGMSQSICHGLDLIGDHVTDVMILLADMPNITAQIINALYQHHISAANPDHSITLPVVKSKTRQPCPANPVIWGKSFLPLLRQITGDKGGRDIIRLHPHAVNPLAMNDDRCFLDADTIDDLAVIFERRQPRRM
jgi:molybdenum cofactor cytidylyltransferase